MKFDSNIKMSIRRPELHMQNKNVLPCFFWNQTYFSQTYVTSGTSILNKQRNHTFNNWKNNS